MKKISKRILGSLLALMLVAVTIVVSCTVALASEGNSSEKENIAPEIVSKNLIFGSTTHILYAVPCDTVREGYVPEMRFYNEVPGEGVEAAYVVTEYEIQSISVITGQAEDYYVFRSKGFPAKKIGDFVYAVPVAVSDTDEIAGKATKYSAAEYCYERLYKAGYIGFGANDGKEYLRRELYLSLLEYGKAAQKVLIENMLGQSVTYVTDYTYFSVEGAECGFAAPGDTVEVPEFSGSLAPGYEFGGWEIVTYRDGKQISVKQVEAGDIISIVAGANVIRPFTRIYDEILAQEGVDAVYLEEKWAVLLDAAVEKYGEQGGAALVEAFKTLYTLYTDDIPDWSASIYAKGFTDVEGGSYAGGYFASTGGRDTEGLGPDVQNTEQMLRFIEGSGMIAQLGVSSVSSLLPDWMKYEIVYFVKSLQGTNGYFYHPQWGQTLTDQHTSRRGRDLGWATNLLGRFGAAPQYDTPNGRTGNGQTADEYLLSLIDAGLVDPAYVPKSFKDKYLTQPLATSAETAISTLILVDSDDVDINEDDGTGNDNTEYAKSYVGLINYLISDVIPGMWKNPYQMGNEIASVQSEIKTACDKLLASEGVYAYRAGDEANTEGASAADYMQFDGMNMKEMVVHALNSCINTEIGLWGKTSEANPTGTEFLFTNGFMKAMAVYNDYKATYPYPVAAANALMAGLLSDQPSTGNICEVYNIWTAIDRLQSNVKSCFYEDQIKELDENGNKVTKEMVTAAINDVFAEHAADAVLNSYEKVKGYKKIDGGFGHNYYSGTSLHQGLQVSNGDNVSDVDATCIGSTGLTREMFAALGLSSYKIPLYTLSDWMRYLEILEDAEPIRKGNPAEAQMNFADATFPEDVSIYGGTMTLVKHNGSNALRVESKKGARLNIMRSDVCNRGSVVRFESDMTFSTTGRYAVLFNTANGVAARFNITVDQSRVTITDSATDKSYTAVLYLGESFTLKLELAVFYDEEAKCFGVVVDGFVNSAYIGEIARFTSGEDLESIDEVTDIKSATLLQLTAGAITVDNLMFVITSSSVPTDYEDLDLNVEYEKPINLVSGGTQIQYSVKNGALSKLYPMAESQNTFLRLEKLSGSTNQAYMHMIGSTVVGNTFVFETALRYNNDNDKDNLKLNIKSLSGAEVWQICIKQNKIQYYPNGKNGTGAYASESAWGITEGKWFTLRVEITTTVDGDFTAVTYVDGIERNRVTTPYDKFDAAYNITTFGVIPDIRWLGTVDVDNTSNRAKNSIIAEEDLDLPENPSITFIPECTVHEYIEVIHENEIKPTCTEPGGYTKVSYCTLCERETERVDVVVPPTGHKEGSGVTENRVDSTCTAIGGYDTVVRCTVCSDVISRAHTEIPMKDHNVLADGKCKSCGNQFYINNVFDLDGYKDGAWNANTVGNALVGHGVQTGATSTVTIVTEDGEKHLEYYKSGHPESGTAQASMNVLRTLDTEDGEAVVFQTEMRHVFEKNNSLYFRFYKSRPANSVSDGTVYGSGADRNLIISVSGGKISIGGVNTGAAPGEWFTLRFVLLGDTVDIYTDNASGEMVYRGSIQRDAWSGLEDCKVVTLMADTTTLHKTDFKYFYFGGEIKYVSELTDTPEATVKVPDGSITFDGIEDGAFVNGTYGDYNVGYVVQNNAIAESTIVTESGNKLLYLDKHSLKENTTSSYQTWLNVQSTGEIDNTRDVYVEMRLRISDWITSGSGVYIRLYDGRNALSENSGGNGINLSGDITFKVSNGVVSVGGNSTGIYAGSWLTVRAVSTEDGFNIYVCPDGSSEFALLYHSAIKEGSAFDCDSLTLMTSAQNLSCFVIDYVYIGNEPTYTPAQ